MSENKRSGGKAAIVTGSGRGIGRATVLELAREGAMCCVVARTVADIESVAHEIEASGGKAIAVAADVSDTESVVNMIEKTVSAFGRLDILVNNAAGGVSSLGHPQGILDTTEEEWQSSMNGTLTSVFRVSRYALPHMIRSGKGAIVNVGSTRAMSGRKGAVAYGAAKAGVVNLTRCMALDLLPYDIRVNCVNPGYVQSEHMKATADLLTHPEKRDEILSAFTQEVQASILKRIEYYEDHPEAQATVLGRGFTGTPRDVANVIVFLASDDASFVNGEIVNVDGGSSAGK